MVENKFVFSIFVFALLALVVFAAGVYSGNHITGDTIFGNLFNKKSQQISQQTNIVSDTCLDQEQPCLGTVYVLSEGGAFDYQSDAIDGPRVTLNDIAGNEILITAGSTTNSIAKGSRETVAGADLYVRDIFADVNARSKAVVVACESKFCSGQQRTLTVGSAVSYLGSSVILGGVDSDSALITVGGISGSVNEGDREIINNIPIYLNSIVTVKGVSRATLTFCSNSYGF